MPPGCGAGPHFRFPGGESLQEHSDRVWQALQEIRDERAAALADRLPSRLDPCGPLPLRSARAGRLPRIRRAQHRGGGAVTKRLPLIGFGLLALATVGAFFLIQALKTANPLIWGDPSPDSRGLQPGVRTDLHLALGPAAQLPRSPAHTRQQPGRPGRGLRRQCNRTPADAVAATISSGTPMLESKLGTSDWHPVTFTWNGRLGRRDVSRRTASTTSGSCCPTRVARSTSPTARYRSSPSRRTHAS